MRHMTTKSKSHLNQLNRQELYDLVWSESMVVLGERFGISDVGLKKRCKVLGVPTPPRGYWAKLAAGKKATKVPLPESWVYVAKKTRLPQTPEGVRKFIPSEVPLGVALFRKEVRNTLNALSRGKPSEDGLRRVQGHGILRTSVTAEHRERAARLWNALIVVLEARGLKLLLAEATTVTDGLESIPLCLRERLRPYERAYDPEVDKRVYYYRQPPPTVKVYVPTGFLAFWAENESCSPRTWKDTTFGPLDAKLGQIAEDIALTLRRKHEIALEREVRLRMRAEEERLEAVEAEKRRREKARREALVERAKEFGQAENVRALLTRLRMLSEGDPLLEDFLVWGDEVAVRLDPCSAILRRARDGDDPLKI